MSVTVNQTCPGLSSGTEAGRDGIFHIQTIELSSLSNQGSFTSNAYQEGYPGPAGFQAMPGKHLKDHRRASEILTI